MFGLKKYKPIYSIYCRAEEFKLINLDIRSGNRRLGLR